MARQVAYEIGPGLWMSGASAALEAGRFDHVLTLCAPASEQVAVPAGSEAAVWRIEDAQMPDEETVRVWARRVAGWLAAGDTVLVRCAAGHNRSGLIVARVLIEQGMSGAQAVARVRQGRGRDALNNPWFVEWLLAEAPDGRWEAPTQHPRWRARALRATSTRWGLDAGEIATTGIAAVASTGLYLVWGASYLARGVVGDLLGFGLLCGPLVVRRRARHEALVCLAAIGLVHAADWGWPLALASGWWWAAFAAGLAGYLRVRWVRLPATRWGAQTSGR